MTRVDEIAHELIDRFHLHDNGAPVDLSPLEDVFRLRYADLTGTGLHGFARMPRRGAIRVGNPATIVIDKHVRPFERRLVYAHEVGHAALGHEGSLRCDAINPWFDEKQEREAWRFAAIILIPTPDDVLDWSVPAIVENCRVTPDLVELWRSAW